MSQEGSRNSYSRLLRRLAGGWLGLPPEEVEEKQEAQRCLCPSDLDNLKREPGWGLVLQQVEDRLARRVGALLEGDDLAGELKSLWVVLSKPPQENDDG